MTFSVLHAPLYAPGAGKNPKAVVSAVRKHKPDSVGFSEAYNALNALDKMSGYRMVMESGGKDKRRGQKDNPIVTRSSFVSRGSGQVFGCEASEPVKIAPERWITYSSFLIPKYGVVTHLNLHPHAGVQGDGGLLGLSNDRGKKFKDQMVVFGRMIEFFQTMGPVTVTGDVNFVDKGTSPWSPYAIGRNYGLKIYSQHFDTIMWSPKLKMQVKEVDRPNLISDHPWLLGVVN